MSFWEWFALLVSAPLWVPFALVSVVLLLEAAAFAFIIVLSTIVLIVEAWRK